MTQLVKYDAAYTALQQATKIDEVKDIRDKAEALRVYAKQANDPHMELWAAEIRIRAERKAGAFLHGMEKAKGGGDQKSNHRSPSGTGGQTLSEIGITKKQSSKWQKMATIPDKKFEDIFTHKTQVGEIWASSAIIKLANGNNAQVERFTGDHQSLHRVPNNKQGDAIHGRRNRRGDSPVAQKVGPQFAHSLSTDPTAAKVLFLRELHIQSPFPSASAAIQSPRYSL